MVGFIITLALITYGGIVSRMHGGGILTLPKVVNNFLWALPFGIATFLIYDVFFSLTLSAVCGIICTLLTMPLKGTGHGQYMNLGMYDVPDDAPEALDPIVDLIYGEETALNKPIRDIIGMVVVGIAAVLPFAIFMAPINITLTAAVFVAGAAKAFAYITGWAYFYQNEFPSPTNTGEVLTGIFAFLGLSSALLYFI